MKTRTLLTLTIILSAVFLAGCVQIEQPRAAETEIGEPPTTAVQPEPEEVAEPEIEEQAAPVGTECNIDADCNDDDKCTTDSCSDGSCINVLITGCEQKKTSDPYINAVNFGADEWIEVRAENYRIDGWTIENQDGKVYYTFKEYVTLNNYLKLYSGRGFATTVEWYLFTNDFWKEGDTAILKNDDGEVIDEKTE